MTVIADPEDAPIPHARLAPFVPAKDTAVVMGEHGPVATETIYRASAMVIKPGAPIAHPIAAAWAGHRTALTALGMSPAAVAVHAVRVHDSGRMGPGRITVDGVGYDGIQILDLGMRIIAAVVEGGWTVVAAVPQGQEAVVVLEDRQG